MRKTSTQRMMMAAVAIACAGGACPAHAQDASAWESEQHAAARLIAGTAVQAANTKWLRAGVEIRLDPGWKTYWRYPGDSGVPPTFDFTGSDNVKAVTTLWPAPELFDDGAGGQSIGYRGDVVLPLHVVRQDADKPASLRVKLGYAVCGNLCLPAQANLDLKLSGQGNTTEGALAKAEARVPRRVPLGAGGDLAIHSVHREAGSPHARVAVDVVAPANVPVELYVEGPTPDWALPLPKLETSPSGASAGMRRYTFELDGLPPGANPDGAKLTLTAVSPTDAIEVEAHLD